jgi:uncharacterized protein Veg
MTEQQAAALIRAYPSIFPVSRNLDFHITEQQAAALIRAYPSIFPVSRNLEFHITLLVKTFPQPLHIKVFIFI